MVQSLHNFLEENIQYLKDNGLYNEIDSIEGANGPEITINGKQYINLSSNNYLGLATNEDLKSAKHAIDSHGVGVVRSINGTLDLHDELEETLAKFKGTEALSLINQVSTVTWLFQSNEQKRCDSFR